MSSEQPQSGRWGSSVVKVIDDGSGWREVRIVQNGDGTFGFEEWRLFDEPLVGPQWAPVGRDRTFADSAETAEREARASIDWLVGRGG